MSQQKKHIFIDRSLWDRAWFDDLCPKYQLAYLILWTESDNVGIWEPHIRKLEFKLKDEINADNFIDRVNSKDSQVRVLNNGNWWIVDFLSLQVKTLTPNNKIHVSYIENLNNRNLLTDYAKLKPKSVNFEKVYELEDYEALEDSKDQKKAKKAFQNLESKKLIRPLKEACEGLRRVSQDSKEKDQEKTSNKENNGGQRKKNNLIANSLGESNGIDTELFPKETLYYHNIAKTLKKITPECVLRSMSNEEMEEDIKSMVEVLESGNVEEPPNFIIQKAENTDWEEYGWKEFNEAVINSALADIPF